MKEKDLIDLGFKKEYGDTKWYYYTYDLADGLSLITNASDELLNGEWYVEVFESGKIRFIDRKKIQEFINIVRKNINE